MRPMIVCFSAMMFSFVGWCASARCGLVRVRAGCERDEASRDWWVGYELPEPVVGSVCVGDWGAITLSVFLPSGATRSEADRAWHLAWLSLHARVRESRIRGM